MRCVYLCKAICCLSLLLANLSFAKELTSLQYDARLCSAQLLVLKGDVKRLQLLDTQQHHKLGLIQRIAGALGTLGWLCRQHKQPTNLLTIQNQINQIRSSFEIKHWQVLEKNLSELVTAIPLDVKKFSTKQLTKQSLNTSISIYKHYCQACHMNPSDKPETPAYSFFEMAKTMSNEEFLARMLVGVHGNPKIALRNPLTDEDITGLVTYFSKASK